MRRTARVRSSVLLLETLENLLHSMKNTRIRCKRSNPVSMHGMPQHTIRKAHIAPTWGADNEI
jgi:hypothetical protein